MPLFKKKLSSDQKKNLDYKLQIAEDKPDSYFDLSDCRISKIPDGVFSKCKVLQKQALLLQNNLLEDFKGGGNFSDLSALMILDISNNKFTQIPKNIFQLTQLQKLVMSSNKIKRLPEEIGKLKELQVLNISDNLISGFPTTIQYLTAMQSLDISENRYLTNLPVNLCYMQQLKDFTFDQERITYPSKAITSKGIGEIQRWFRKVKGDEFIEDQTDHTPDTSPKKLYTMPSEESNFEDAILERERLRSQKDKERLRLEQEIMETREDNARLLANAQFERQQVLREIEKHDIAAQEALVKQFAVGSTERNKMLEDLYLENDHLDKTVNFVLQMSESSRNTDALLEELELEQSRMDELVKITSEETERLRKQEIIEAMDMIMKDSECSRRQWNHFERTREEEWKKSLLSEEESTEGLEKILSDSDRDKRHLVNQIMTEEDKQKEAFRELQYQKDIKLNRLNKQVELIEKELARLTLLEIQKREEKKDQEINTLADMRIQTALLLSQLVDEQEKREGRLKHMLVQMEKGREDDAKDYWLIQFQRLLDNKPQILIDAENKLDIFVADVIMQAGCKEYLPHFARHNVDEQEILVMAAARLNEIGVHDKKAQEDIIAAVKSCVLMNEQLSKGSDQYGGKTVQMNDESMEVSQSAPPTVPTMDISSECECVVCLDKKPEVVFLPCGHVCTCTDCCPTLKDCPICRQEVTQKFRLFGA